MPIPWIWGHGLPAAKNSQLMTHDLLVCTKQETSAAGVFGRSHSMHGTCVGTSCGCAAGHCCMLHAASVDLGAALPVVKKTQLMTQHLLVCTKQETHTADVFSRSHSMHGVCVGTALGCTAALCGVLHADSVDLGPLWRW